MRVEGDTRRGAGREGREESYSSFSASLPGGRRKEEVNIYEDREEREHRPRRTETYREDIRSSEHRPGDRIDHIDIEREP